VKTRIKIRRLDVEIEGDGLNMRMVAVNAEGNGPGVRAALRGLVEALDFRESGGSIPPVEPTADRIRREARAQRRREPPPLNKSGGSDVEEK
jgi:hypothetical protein